MAMLSHRQGWSLAVVLSIFPYVFSAGSTSDLPSATLRTGTAEVRISFFATDENDRLIQTLGRDDFAVVDSEAVIRDFRSVSHSSEIPLDVVLLVDASESVAPRFRAMMEDVSRFASGHSTTSSDRVSVFTFAGLRGSTILCEDDCATPGAREKLLAVKPGGATPLFDALSEVAEFATRRQRPDVRQILILLSDGNDTISGNSPREAVDAIVASGAPLYTINLNPSLQLGGRNMPLNTMAELTGGRSLSLQGGILKAFDSVLNDQRAAYIVTYALPSHVAGFHSLCILPKHNLNLRFHCRRGYYL